MDRPVKGILKKNSGSNLVSSRKRSEEDSQKKSQTWDEMNIIATYKPAGKDYGLMDINEAKTPFRYDADDEAGSSAGPSFSIEELRTRMGALSTANKGKREKTRTRIADGDEDDTPLVERERKRQFELRRKQIYDEGRNIKRARELIAHEELEDHDDSDSVHDEGYKYREQDDHQALPAPGTQLSGYPERWLHSLIRKMAKYCCPL